jgi:hypothetical protein
MFDIHCHRCDRPYLVGTRSIVSFHNTSEGPVAYVSCPQGHVLLRSFRDARSHPLEAVAAASSRPEPIGTAA